MPENLVMNLLIEVFDYLNFFLEKKYLVKAENLDGLCKHLGIKEMEELISYEIPEQYFSYLNSEFNIHIGRDKKAKMRHKLDFDDLPYELHTSRELPLMLEGKKPLSVFVSHNSICEKILFPEETYDTHVRNNRLFKKINVISENERMVLYSLPGQQWRMDAYIFLMDVAKSRAWSSDFEFIEGGLLGYTNEENSHYIDYLKRIGKINN